MSAQATLRRTAGSAATHPAVLAGGISLGLILWFGLAAGGVGHGAFAVPTLVAATLLGIAIAALACSGYAGYLARRGKIPYDRALVLDAWSWLALVLFPVLVFQPFGVVSNGRAFTVAIAAFALAKLLTAARLNQTVREVLLIFVVTRIPLVVIAELAWFIIGQRAGTHVATSANPLLAVWGRWDAVHYLNIAQHGYYGTDMAFFPLYPALIHVLGRLTGSNVVAGLAISNGAAFFGLLYFYKLVEHQWNRTTAQRAVFYVSIFPTAIFFSAIYTESLFFALTVASVYYMRERRWIVAGLFGCGAALTRVEGVLLVVPYAIEIALHARALGVKLYFRSLRYDASLVAGAALIGLGLLMYMSWLWVLRGDPLYFSHVQSHWDRHLAPPWVSVIDAVQKIVHSHAAQTISGQSIELAFTALMIVIFFGGLRVLPVSFSAYMALSILLPISTSSLMSTPRFALVLFPMFVTLAVWGSKSWVNNAIVAFSLPLLGLFTVLFADWYWVA